MKIHLRHNWDSSELTVLHLYAGNLFGGIETLLTTMARQRHLAPAMEPEFGLCFHGRLRDELVAAGVTVHDLGFVRLSRPWTVSQARRRLRQILADCRPEVVITHEAWPHMIFGPVVRHAGIGLVYFVHGHVNGRHWLTRLARWTPPDRSRRQQPVHCQVGPEHLSEGRGSTFGTYPFPGLVRTIRFAHRCVLNWGPLRGWW